jgi:thiol-disulfide isomerase/thioredoxin
VRALIVVALAACSAAPPKAAQTTVLPTDAQLAPYRGRVVVLDFWAGWCAECKRTIPQIQRLAAAFASEGLVVVGVNAGDPKPEAAAYAKELGIDYPIVLDPELDLSDRLGAGKLPMLLVVGRDGTIVHRAKHVDEATLGVIRKLLHDQRSAKP